MNTIDPTMALVKGNAGGGVTSLIPKDLRGLDTSSRTIFTGRTHRRIDPTVMKTYNKNNRICNFEFPRDSVVDMQMGYFAFTAEASPKASGGPPATTWARFPNGIWSIIEKISITFGTVPIEVRDKYGFIKYNDWYNTANFVTNTNQMFEIGVGNAATRQTWAQTPRMYVCPLDLAVLKRPMNFAALDKVTIQFTFYEPQKCLECDATTASSLTTLDYTITNVHFVVDYLPGLNSLFLNDGKNIMDATNQMRIGRWNFEATQIWDTTVTGTKNMRLIVPFKCSSLQGVRLIQQPDGELENPAVIDRYVEARPYRLKLFQTRLNGVPFPITQVHCLGDAGDDDEYEAFYLYKRYWYKTSMSLEGYDQLVNIDRTQFYSTSLYKFFFAFSYEQNHAPGDMNPVKINDTSSLIIDLEWESNVTSVRLFFLIDLWELWEYRGDWIVSGR